ncbi:50S ribosomal protein L29 [Candidatus Azambacteria bacterium RBG_16_47_10]|uniref:Large ribosomal subunit protein uL29 n=1 Tax=Candidatus Azambacteria bacterium RBG_16_47_10 TaxID=1797292 RepID=A0A1F5AY09_9BACT|nr:MAG: 50S ribosomal protein L29 [Candidatus Azambacteria bacterium RBG_16_47_10]
MKKKTETLHGKSEAELERDLAICEEDLRKLRFDQSFNKLKNVKALGEKKKERARIMTLLRQKQVV